MYTRIQTRQQLSECDVLGGACNKKDLKILSNCEEVIGTVMHTKKMEITSLYEELRHKYNDLLNKNKTSGYFSVEIVPKDQNTKDEIKPNTSDKADAWGAMVTDKPKG